MAKLKKGDQAPELGLLDQDNNEVSLSDFEGKKLLVYFYPRADTPGCTTQSCSVSEAMPRLGELGIDAVGISPDTPRKQKSFDEKYSLGFPLLSDQDNEVAKAFGAWGEKTSFGKTKEGIVRSSFLIDEQGLIVEAWYNVKPDETVPKATAAASS